MNDEYRKVYERLYGSSQQNTPWVAAEAPPNYARHQYGWEEEERWLRTVIAEAENHALEKGQPLRSDAKLWLLMTAMSLIVVPVTLVGKVDRTQMRALVKDDVLTIVDRSLHQGQEGLELSAHRLIDGLHASWKDLKSAALEIWE